MPRLRHLGRTSYRCDAPGSVVPLRNSLTVCLLRTAKPPPWNGECPAFAPCFGQFLPTFKDCRLGLRQITGGPPQRGEDDDSTSKTAGICGARKRAFPREIL